MRRHMTFCIILMISCILSGCAKNAIPEMNEEQQNMVVEYAVSNVLKYDKNYENKLVEQTMEETEQEAVNAEALPEQEELPPAPDENSVAPISPEPSKEEALGNNQEGSDGNVTVIDNTGENGNIYTSIEDALGIPDIQFTYVGYETCDFYPKEAGDLYFEMNATEGNRLLVLKFQALNVSTGDSILNMAESNTRFKIVINGESKNALTTMLLDDLAYYQGTLLPGEQTELVLICEIPNSLESQIASLELIVKNVETNATISLQ